jgi:hypothetical protein
MENGNFPAAALSWGLRAGLSAGCERTRNDMRSGASACLWDEKDADGGPPTRVHIIHMNVLSRRVLRYEALKPEP